MKLGPGVTVMVLSVFDSVAPDAGFSSCALTIRKGVSGNGLTSLSSGCTTMTALRFACSGSVTAWGNGFVDETTVAVALPPTVKLL